MVRALKRPKELPPARGWRLVKRGRYLSRFAPVEPSAARYRIEVYTPPFLEDRTLPEGQLAVFEDCGWEYAADHGFPVVRQEGAGAGDLALPVPVEQRAPFPLIAQIILPWIFPLPTGGKKCIIG